MALTEHTSPSAQTDIDSNSSSETDDCDLEWCCHMSTTEMILSLDEAEHWHESRLLQPTPFTPPGTRTPLSPSIHFSRFALRDAVPLQQQLPTGRSLFNHPPPPPPPEFEFCKVYCDILMRSAMILNGIANHYGNDNDNRDYTAADGLIDSVVDEGVKYDGRSKHRRGPSLHRIRGRQHQPWSTTTQADDKEQQHQHQKTSIIRRISSKSRHHLRHKRYQSSSSSGEEEELSKTKGVRAMMAGSDSPIISTPNTTAQSSVMPLKDINQSNRELPSSDERFLNLNQALPANCWVVSSSTNNKTHLAMMEASEYNEKFLPSSDKGNTNHLDLDHHDQNEEESNLATASSSRVRRFWVKLKKKSSQLRHHGDARIASSSDC